MLNVIDIMNILIAGLLSGVRSDVYYDLFSGVLPDTVIEHDIDPMVDLKTAHER